MNLNSSLFNEFVCKLGFWHEWASETSVPKRAQFTQERVEYNVFLFDEPLKGSKSLKIFKISLTFRFDKLWHLSKSAHTGEISQILTVSSKKIPSDYKWLKENSELATLMQLVVQVFSCIICQSFLFRLG
jgi:hypothetical protein